MCGFCGAVSSQTEQAPLDEPSLVRMRDTLVHRGPDDHGTYLGPGVALGSRRLSILDLSERGHMPMATDDGRYRIVYNGEVYNYRELRRELEAQGHVFHSNTDTEVVLKAFVSHGASMLDRLNGMFAIAIWDSRERSLFLARDRLGIKPLYYALRDGVLYFASEPKAILELGVPAEFNHDTWDELLCFRFVAGRRTVLKGIERLLPGHYLIWKDRRLQERRWWNLSDRALAKKHSIPEEPESWFRHTFDDAVDMRRISDVPVGVMLSGGLDSSCVAAALALRAGSGVESFTVGFAERRFDETPFARAVAARWNLTFHELKVPPDGLMARLKRASWLLDEPLTHTNDAHVLALADYAKPRVTVLLSGEGADEILNGYVRYQLLWFPWLWKAGRSALVRSIPDTFLPRRLRKLRRFLSMDADDALVLYNACDVLPSELALVGIRHAPRIDYRLSVLAEAKEAYRDDPLRQAMYSDQHTFLCSLLDRNDRMTMGASIECRVPFLDYRLVEQVAALPTSALLPGVERKALLRRAVGNRLPSKVRRHRKVGFEVPWEQYLHREPEFRDFLVSLADREPIASGPLDRRLIGELVERYLLGNSESAAMVKNLVMIAIWHDEYVRHFARTS